jgi:hypothetical protein
MCKFFQENTVPNLKTKCNILPEDGKHIAKHPGEAHLIFVVMKNVQLLGTINGVG